VEKMSQNTREVEKWRLGKGKQSRVGGKRTTPTSKTNMSKEPNHGQQDAETRKYIKRCVISMENFEGSDDMERGTLPGCCFPLRPLLLALDWSLGYLLFFRCVGGSGCNGLEAGANILPPRRGGSRTRTATRKLVEGQGSRGPRGSGAHGSRARSPFHPRGLILGRCIGVSRSTPSVVHGACPSSQAAVRNDVQLPKYVHPCLQQGCCSLTGSIETRWTAHGARRLPPLRIFGSMGQQNFVFFQNGTTFRGVGFCGFFFFPFITNAW
jgi:hypothetical protein